MIHFGEPLALLLLLVVAGIGVALFWLARWRSASRRRFAGDQAARWPAGGSWLKAFLLLAGATLVALAAARPQWGTHEQSRQQQGIDLVVVLDISQSMQAKDVKPSRMGLAQEELSHLLGSMHGSRIGLVFFSGTAIVRSPLTTDIASVVQLIKNADKEGGLTRAGTDIGAGLDQAATVLKASDSAGKAVLVVSDGEDFGQTQVAKATQLRDQGVVVYTAGTGTTAGTTLDERLQNGQTRIKTDSSGKPVITRLDESKLQALAAAGGGRYVLAGSQGGMTSLQNDFAHLQPVQHGAEVETLPIERFQWFIAAGIILLVASWLYPFGFSMPALGRLPRLRTGHGLALVLIGLFLAGACGGSSLRSRNAAANRLYNAGDYQGAVDAYEALLKDRPDVPELSYNAGNALDRLGNLQRAVEQTQKALPPSSKRLGEATYYALGNHLLALGQLDDAFQAYKSALLLDPTDQDAKYNLEVTLLAMKQQNQQQKQQQGQQQNQQQGQSGQQTPGDQQDQGQQQQGQQQPQEQQGAEGQTGQNGQAPQPGQTDQSPSAAQRSLQDALKGLDQNMSVEDALRVLDLLRQQLQQQKPPASGPNQSIGPDY